MSKGPTEMPWEDGVRIAEAWVLQHRDELERVAVVGSVLRRKPDCHDVDLLVIPKPGLALVEPDPPINLFVAKAETWAPHLMQYAPCAGSTIGTRARAKAQGFKLSQYGLFRRDDNSLVSTDARVICATIAATLSQWVDRSLRGDLVLMFDGAARVPLGGG